MDGVEIPPNIQAAMRRSRAMRQELRSRRRRRAAAVIAALSVATAIPLSLSFADFRAGDVLEAAVSRAQSLTEMLEKRSPGERTEAQLTKHKRALAKVRAAPRLSPTEVVLAKILMGSPEPLPVELAAAPLLPTSALPAPAAIVAPPGAGTIILPPGGGGIIVPPGDGPGGTTPGSPPSLTPPGSTPPPEDKPPVVTPPGNTPPDQPPPVITPPGDTPPPPVPPVPEPATWMMMLVGFGLIGWRIRYSPRDKLTAA
jgi:hypothetical protein